MLATRLLKYFVYRLTAFLWLSGALSGQELHPAHSDEDAGHFSHPMIAESPSPDSKVRLDYYFADLAGKRGTEHTVRFESEIVLAPQFSVEVSVPYVFLRESGSALRRFDSIEIAFKFARVMPGKNTLLLGGGFSLNLPTGKDAVGIGSDHIIDFEPFVDLAYKKGNLELVGFTTLGLPFNEQGDNEADLEWSWNLSGLYHLSARIEPLIELDGAHIFGGSSAGFDAIAITPAVKFAPLSVRNFQLGLGLSLPLDKGDTAVTALVSSFYHF